MKPRYFENEILKVIFFLQQTLVFVLAKSDKGLKEGAIFFFNIFLQPVYNQISEWNPIIVGILIAGGSGAGTSTEVFFPSSGKTCMVADLPDDTLHIFMMSMPFTDMHVLSN